MSKTLSCSSPISHHYALPSGLTVQSFRPLISSTQLCLINPNAKFTDIFNTKDELINFLPETWLKWIVFVNRFSKIEFVWRCLSQHSSCTSPVLLYKFNLRIVFVCSFINSNTLLRQWLKFCLKVKLMKQNCKTRPRAHKTNNKIAFEKPWRVKHYIWWY